MRTPLLLYGLALLVRGLLIWHFPDPAYPDSAYYVDVARALHAGQGFNVDFIWIFPEVGGKIPAVPTLPIPSNAHWMPLASIVQVPFLMLFGDVAWASALPFALIGAIAAPLTWVIAREAGARPFVAIGAGVLVAIPVLSTAYMAQPDNFSLYQPLVIASLWMAARALRGTGHPGRSFVLAGLFAGVATLARNDGLFVMVSLGLVFLFDRWRAWRSAGSRRPTIPFAAAVGAVAVFLLVMAPWWARQLAVFGSLSPSTTSGKVLFIRDIGEWNSITIPATLDHLLGMGIGPLIETRIGGAVAAVFIYLTLVCGFVLGPTMIVGGWARRRSTDFGPFFVYAAILFAFSAIVSAVHVPGGTFIHSAVALAPYSYILALEGIVIVIAWVGRPPAGLGSRGRPQGVRRRDDRVRHRRGVPRLAVGPRHLGGPCRPAAGRRRTRSTRPARPPSDRVMSIDASSTKYWSGHGGVVLVNDPLDTIHQVATAYDIRWLVLDRADSVSAVAPILDGAPLPAWLGPPIMSQGSPTQLAVYPVLPTPAAVVAP